ncbi:MAG: 1-acyl-sn-glycerol-3-phosphate acyltransferase [Anaerolineae bacterium]|uniref:lysophospholipid acyltransferase family protein n=1 Tax=Candidatus Amarolinea dominans TaxID=3140696 RepID=UPI0031353D88|nr:1-acyl-sn-glycerol-3-phosphate acyltransferase [Anaerolineae bacterium]
MPISKIENYDIPLFGADPLVWGHSDPSREVDVRAIKACEAVLAAGHVLLMAPEGTRSRDASLQVGKEGLAFVARKSDPVIVPVAITGSTALTASFKRLRPVPVHLRYGTPFRFRWPEGN